MSAPSGTDAARVRCLYCGANNFPASPSCWQCGRPLQALPAGAAPTTGPGPATAPARTPSPSSPAPPSGAVAPLLGARGASFAGGASGAGEAATATAVHPALAAKAAAALGLLFPPVALPVGMVFLMLDDPRKTQLGWITIGWSVVGAVLNVIFLIVPALALLKSFLPGAGHGGGLPGLPPMPGGDTENILTLLYSSTLLVTIRLQQFLSACPISV